MPEMLGDGSGDLGASFPRWRGVKVYTRLTAS
jgi:hypothetical protein